VNAKEITFTVERDEDSGWLTASWDAPNQTGGITTQGKDLAELERNLREAVECHFQPGKLPKRIRLRFVNDAVLATT
jgi:predicted RNase H-like HicB family nuclease